MFFCIFSYQVILFGSKTDNFGAWKSAYPAMYHSTIPIHFPRSSLRTKRQTDKQTNKQKDMLILLIYKTRASPVDGHSCSPSPIPVSFPVRNPRLYSPSPSLLLFLFTENYSLTLSIDSNMSHLNQPSNSIIC